MSDFKSNKKLKLLPLPYIGMYDLDLIYQTSDVELLYQILAKVNEIAQSQNIIIDDFEKILDWAQNQIEKFTKEQLEEWLNDGTLENMIMQIGQIVKYFDTTVEMIASSNLQNGQVVKTLGYSNVNDGGGGIFKIVNTVDTNNYQFTITGGLYATLIPLNLNPKQYGCTDDKINDFSVLQKYVDMCLDSNVTEIDLYNLKYYIDDSILNELNHYGLYLKKPCVIKNGYLILKENVSNMTSLICLNVTDNTRAYTLDNIIFDGGYDNQTGSGTEDGGKHGVFIGVPSGIKETINVSDVNIIDCHFEYLWSYCICVLNYMDFNLNVINCTANTRTIFINEGSTNTYVYNCKVNAVSNNRGLPISLVHNEMELSTTSAIVKNKTTKIINCVMKSDIPTGMLYKIDGRPQGNLTYNYILIDNCLCYNNLLINIYNTSELTISQIDINNNIISMPHQQYSQPISFNVINCEVLNIKGEYSCDVFISGSVNNINIDKYHYTDSNRLNLDNLTASVINIDGITMDTSYSVTEAQRLLPITDSIIDYLIINNLFLEELNNAYILFAGKIKIFIVNNFYCYYELFNINTNYTELVKISSGVFYNNKNNVFYEQYNNNAPVILTGIAYNNKLEGLPNTYNKSAGNVQLN